MVNIDTRKEIYLLNYDQYQDAILYDIETGQVKNVDWEDIITDKMLGYFHKVEQQYYFLFAANYRIFFRAEGWEFEFNAPTTYLSMATAKGITYFRAENETGAFNLEYPSWRTELGMEKPDIVSDIVEEDDELYDFFYYIYGMWLSRDFISTYKSWVKISDEAYDKELKK
jgi:hypothetical protein